MDCDPFAPHVDSFNYLLDEGLMLAAKDVDPEEFKHSDGSVLKLQYTGAELSAPSLAKGISSARVLTIYPAECRQRGITYSGKLKCAYAISVNGRCIAEFERTLADIPIMVMSKLCNLHGMNGKELIEKREEETEKGGFFVVKGIDKVLRLVIALRQNYPLALVRERWRSRGPYFSEYGIMIRCVKDHHSSITHTVHYLETRRIVFVLTWMKRQYLIPVWYLLRALGDCPDYEIYEALTRGRSKTDGWRRCIENVMRDVKNQRVDTREDALKHLGVLFRLPLNCPEWYSDAECGIKFLWKCILIHCRSDADKLNCLVYMVRKLAALVNGECKEENPDNPIMQEVILPAYPLLMLIKEKLKTSLRRVRYYMMERMEKEGSTIGLSKDLIENAFRKAPGKEVGRAVEYLLATGNVLTNGESVLPQTTGFSVVAERINHLRYTSHFRAIHRGAIFQDSRTTDVRKLRPEAWGFICPVHTPDGAPCGLLNHLAAACSVTCRDGPVEGVLARLNDCGLISVREQQLVGGGDGESAGRQDQQDFVYPVLLNGVLVGYLNEEGADSAVASLRTAKTNTSEQEGALAVSPFTEVVLVPRREFPNLYPSLWICTNGGRMVRPVSNLYLTDRQEQPTVEYIGTFEQIYLNIAVTPDEFEKGVTTHQELAPTSMFSYIANLIPYPDHNQSPRNVYQCQMSKQTMGWNAHALQYRSDNKLYRLQTPQSPLVQTNAYANYDVDRYPLGTNAIVAVIAYTGYDMEDGMVINKASYERGYAMGCVYKSERVDLTQIRGSKLGQYAFARDPNVVGLAEYLDPDGLPYIGRKYEEGNPLYCYLDVDSGIYKTKRYGGSEVCYIDNIKVCGAETGEELLNHVVIMLRITRKPNIGDKFASRHGQKGICSFLWPSQNMPFTETGMVPDIIFNPHGFPSRMTVGMMIECMAGKSAAAHGLKHDATPFLFSESFPAVQYFGECLQKAGYNYYGNEPMYSGIDGREFQAHIFFGVVYYQRLRHMVADKFQVRATGGIDPVTHQPVKGRKKGGGVRFGEMERDSVISHGAAMIIHDRLFSSSDRDHAHVCSKCGDHQSVMFQIPDVSGTSASPLGKPSNRVEDVGVTELEDGSASTAIAGQEQNQNDDSDRIQCGRVWYCRVCKSSKHVKLIAIPHVFKYLIAELVSMNVKVNFSLPPETK